LNGLDNAEFPLWRGGVYGFLSLIARTPPDKSLIDRLSQYFSGVGPEILPQPFEAELHGYKDVEEGITQLRGFLENNRERLFDEGFMERLSAIFTRIFRGLRRTRPPPPPYGSIYLGVATGDYSRRLLSIYIGEGFKIVSGELPDSLWVELEFMSHLCFREHDALVRGDESEARGIRVREIKFIEGYLLPWIPSFCDIALRVCDEYGDLGAFYKAYLHMLKGYLYLDKEILRGMLLR